MTIEQRRVPICTINWCCPYRGDLCTMWCTGERAPKSDYMVVRGDHAVIGGTRYYVPEKTREAFRAFDRGDPPETIAGDYVFEAPRRRR
jgi:hypothetical protein